MNTDNTEVEKIREDWLTRASGMFKLAGFSDFFFTEIPNEYCGDRGDCSICQGHPWLLVSTPVGIFKTGWRKRVIVIDWSRTSIKDDAIAIFGNETYPTRFDKVIHAYSYADAAAYLEKVRSRFV
jgi:hypothetical protein